MRPVEAAAGQAADLAVPRATYRLQFTPEFGFEAARRVVPYLASLGVSHLYASPIFAARSGSTHGYDVVDHTRLNPELGDEAAFGALVDALRRHGMGLILDFVPNHMGVGTDNPWWVDVLAWGRASRAAAYFDIDWSSPERTLAGKVLLPVLGDHYGAVLERGELRLRALPDEGRIVVAYFDHAFPLAPRDYAPLLRDAAARAGEGPAGTALAELGSAFEAALSERPGAGIGRERARRDRAQALSGRLASSLAEHAAAREALHAALAATSGEPGSPRSFDPLHRLLERQHYRLAYWRTAAHEINYRRFFDVNDLAGLRMEVDELFRASHTLVARLIAEGTVQGLRLDHVDGLRDPKAYLERLQELPRPTEDPLYVAVEKILAPHESLRSDWPVSGTTGYEFLADVNGLQVDPAAERPLTRTYARLTDGPLDVEAEIVAAKGRIMSEALASELNVLANAFTRLAKSHRASRDYTLLAFREALARVAAHFPVYRTYVTAAGAAPDDRRDIDWAVARARKGADAPDTSIYDFVHGVLTLDLLDRARADGRGYRRDEVVVAAQRFQQYTGPVTAKAVEDTVFYRYVRLVSQNEVGAEPHRFGTSPAAFHEGNRRRRRTHPHAMLTTSTHDHKRGEDVRARLNVLSERPQAWDRRVRRWMQLNARKRRSVDDRPAPSRLDEYLYYQTLVGAWPLELTAPGFEGLEAFAERMGAYMLKAAREAKLRTGWAAPDEAYEGALAEFVARTLDPKVSGPFVEDLAAFAAEIAPAGAVNGLAQLLLKLTSPGVPDVYGGTERWDLSLVDPDNRRTVDHGALAADLAQVATADPDALLASWRDGRVKGFVMARALRARRDDPATFAEGDYLPLAVEGVHAHRVVAFARVLDARAFVVVTPRLAWPLVGDRDVPLPSDWAETRITLPDELAAYAWTDVLTGDVRGPSALRFDDSREGLEVGAVLSRLPVALLRRG